MQQIENFLDKEDYNKILDAAISDSLPWYYTDSVTDKNENDFMLSHVLYWDNKINSDYYNTFVLPIMSKIKHQNILRAKVNFYTKREKQYKHGFHVDDTNPHVVALYSINTNNGYTEFVDGNKFRSIANSLILFNGNIKHRSVNQTDTKQRLNININYI
jgi:hypothetical protein